LKSFGETLRAQLMSLDIKGKDAGTMNDELTKCLDTSKGGGFSTCEYLNTKVEELHKYAAALDRTIPLPLGRYSRLSV
jgi:hypothetical protein